MNCEYFIPNRKLLLLYYLGSRIQNNFKSYKFNKFTLKYLNVTWCSLLFITILY